MDSERIRTKEHATFEVDAERFFVNGSLQLYEETQQRNYFQIRAKNSRLIFQAGAFIGLIPINERITIEVAPRTPINNLDRLLRIAGAEAEVVSRITRTYGETDEDLSLVDVMADELIRALGQIALDGRMKTYERSHHVGTPRAGRILVAETLRARAAHLGTLTVASSRFERTANNIFNSVLKIAIERLVADIRGPKPRKGWRERLRGLNEGWQLFASVDGRLAKRTDVEGLRGRLPRDASDAYRRALAVAIAVLTERSPSVLAEDGPLTLTSVIYNLSTAFERYVRNALREDASLATRDGNSDPPAGARRKLFADPSTPGLERMAANPDLVFGSVGAYWCAGDIKYKMIADAPDREDLNQVLAYAVAYKVDTCLLVYPASKGMKGLMDCGAVGTKRVYCYGVDLNAADMAAEENAMRAAVRSLRPPLP